MQIPAFENVKFVDEKGMLTPTAEQMLKLLFQQLIMNVGEEGFVLPQQTDASIALLTNSANGTILYDSTTDQFKGLVAGVFKTFTLT
jgi:hypothetical protein